MTDPSHFPFTFDPSACETCRGTCCRWGGYVWITEDELMEIARFRGMDPGVFANTYVKAAYGRLSLQDRLINGEHICCMFDPADCKCMIYECRPSQCRTFPFWDQFRDGFKELEEYCPGVKAKD